MFPGMHGWVLYRVERGDTLVSIRRKTRAYTSVTANQIALANPQITDTSHIPPGMKLRIPMKE
jgi:nucleoid-associated protein YgaU